MIFAHSVRFWNCTTELSEKQAVKRLSLNYSRRYGTEPARCHITQSMDGRKRWADNIRIERWFRSLKQEEIYINEYQTPRELRHAVGEYIRKYNTVRPHQALDNQTPDAVFYASFSRSATIAAGLDSAPLAC